MRDATKEILEAVRATLMADPVLGPVLGDRIVSDYGVELEPPFIRMQIPQVLPWETDCGEGSSHALHVHVFTRESGRDQISLLVDRVVICLDDAPLSLPTSSLWELTRRDTINRVDPTDPERQTARCAFQVITTEE